MPQKGVGLRMYTVLLIDDEPSILEGLKKIIAWEEYGVSQVYTVTTAEQALSIMEREQISIMITDVCMQPVSGLELIELARKVSPETKYMILSGYDDFSYVKKGMALGIENYLLKPVDEEELITSLIHVEETIEKELSEKIRREANVGIIRNNILLRWLNNNIPQRELQEKSEGLQLDLNAENYWVAVISDTDSVGIHTDTASWEEKYCTMENALAWYRTSFEESAYVTMNMQNQIVFIFHGDFHSYEKEKLKLKNGMERMKNLYGQQVYLAIGSVITNYKAVPESYKNALWLLHLNTHMETNTVREWVTDRGEKSTLETMLSINTDCIRNSVEELNEEKTMALLEEFVTRLYKDASDEYWKELLFFNQITMNILRCVEYQDCPEVFEKAEKFLVEIHFGEKWNGPDYLVCLKEMASDVISYLKKRKEEHSPIVREMLKAVEQEYTGELSLAILAERFNGSSVYLGQLFKNETGDYFSEYLNKFRIEKAKEMLLEGKKSVTEIGTLVGYASKTHFFSNFKKITGMTPMEFKRNISK